MININLYCLQNIIFHEKDCKIVTLHYNWPISAHASHAFSMSRTDSVIMPLSLLTKTDPPCSTVSLR